MIVVQSLHHDFVPSNWAMYYPTFWDWVTLLGSIGLFFDFAAALYSLHPTDFDFRVA